MLHAQSTPRIGAIYPIGGQTGTTVTINFYGENLDEVTGIVFSGDPGLSAEIPQRGEPLLSLISSKGGISLASGRDGKTAVAKITIAPDAPLGPRDIRVVTPNGVSSPLRFHVGGLPEVIENEAIDPDKDAQAVTLPVTITGRITPANDVDAFRFAAKKGQRMILEVVGVRIGSELDSTLMLFDSAGKLLAQDEDTNGVDSLIDFTIPEDGDYTAKIRDLRYQGSPDFIYRLNIGELPYLDMVYPFGGQRGKETSVALMGRNLDGAAAMKLAIDKSAPLGRQDIRTHGPRGISNPFPFEVGDAPEVMETEPNNSIAEAKSFGAPVTINGRIEGAGDIDTFKIKVDSRMRLVFDINASRYRSPLDPLLTLANADGGVLAQNDDAEGADARIDYTFDPGEYAISVRDLLNRGGDRFGYRLEVGVPQPDFSVRFFPENPRVCRGGTASLRAEITRENGFGGAVELLFENLPPGVTGSKLLLAPDQPPAGLMTLTAAEDAPLTAAPFKIAGYGIIGGQRERRTALPVSAEKPFGAPRVSDRPAREAVLAVSDLSAFCVAPISLTAQAQQGGIGTLEVQVARHKGFTGDITLTLEGFSERRESISGNIAVQPLVLKGSDTRGVISFTAKADSETGTRPVTIIGTANVEGRNIIEASPTVPLTVYEIPFMLTSSLTRLSLTALPPGTESAAGEAQFAVRAERRGWFTDEIPLTVEGLPEGINVAITNIGRGAGETTIRLTASDKAQTGQTATFTVVGRVNLGGRPYEHRTLPITLAVNAPDADLAGGK